MQERTRLRTLAVAGAKGAICGLAGVAVMTVGEKLEQGVTGRTNSYVPARTLLTLMGRASGQSDKPVLWNHAMHWGTGALLGILRGMWSVIGIRGALADTKHTGVRLAFDQTLENAIGMGAPPSTWSREEQIVDVLHKAVYSIATGTVADRWIQPRLESRAGTMSH